MYCSIYQAVDIWDDLRDAMEGKHGYGGTDAEIYAYRLMRNTPMMSIATQHKQEDIIRAAQSLVSIIEMFQDRHEVIFLIDGLECHSWLQQYGHTFDHRVKVQFNGAYKK